MSHPRSDKEYGINEKEDVTLEEQSEENFFTTDVEEVYSPIDFINREIESRIFMEHFEDRVRHGD